MQTYLIDASIFVFRAWFTIPDSMTDPEEKPGQRGLWLHSFSGRLPRISAT